MPRLEAVRRYDVPVERGFAFITDTAHWPRFWPGFVRLEEGSRWGAPGDTARMVTRLLGRERELSARERALDIHDRYILYPVPTEYRKPHWGAPLREREEKPTATG